MNYALLLSGGTGERAGEAIPKQYVRAASHMMVTWALYTLLSCDMTDAVFIVADEAWHNEILFDIKSMGLSSANMAKLCGFARPGESRQLSILNGLDAIRCNLDLSGNAYSDTILIHDAARPFITDDLLKACYKALDGHDGVMPVLPVKDTVYLSDDGKGVAGLTDRQRLFFGQAPELFKLKKYCEANEALIKNGGKEGMLKINGASEPAIMSGMDIVMIEGDEDNFKITTAGDLKRYKELMR